MRRIDARRKNASALRLRFSSILGKPSTSVDPSNGALDDPTARQGAARDRFASWTRGREAHLFPARWERSPVEAVVSDEGVSDHGDDERKAADLAGEEIDRLGDQAATGEERASRKRRLIKGPREFRDIRADRPKPKS